MEQRESVPADSEYGHGAGVKSADPGAVLSKLLREAAREPVQVEVSTVTGSI